MSRIKQAVYAASGVDEIDVTPEALDELESKGAALVLDWQTFAKEYNPGSVYEADEFKMFHDEQDDYEPEMG
jgi:hypothetical protein